MSRSSTMTIATHSSTAPTDYSKVFDDWFAASFGRHFLTSEFIRSRTRLDPTQSDPVSKSLLHAQIAVNESWSQDCKLLAGGSNHEDADRARLLAAYMLDDYLWEADMFGKACQRQPPIGTGRPVSADQTSKSESWAAANTTTEGLTPNKHIVPAIVVTPPTAPPTGVPYIAPTSLIALSASGLRVDLDLPPRRKLDDEELRQLRSRLCFDHNLRSGGCTREARCKNNHEPVGRDVRAALAVQARKIPCKQGRSCRDGDCFWGHTCRWERCKRMALTNKREACILPEEMHRDREIVQCVHASTSETEDTGT